VLQLAADMTAVTGDENNFDRPCRSAELQLKGSEPALGPYGDLEFRMRVLPRAGTNASGKTGFISGVTTGAAADGGWPQHDRGIGLEFGAMDLSELRMTVITNNDRMCDRTTECTGNYSKVESYENVSWAGFLSYKIEWRWHFAKFYFRSLDTEAWTLLGTIRRPDMFTAWPDSATWLQAYFTLPDASLVDRVGGAWTNAEVGTPAWTGTSITGGHRAEFQYVKFTPCAAGQADCIKP